MSTQPPFSWLMQAADKLRAQLPPDLAQAMQPPTWLVHEAQQRMVLFFNHVLMQAVSYTHLTLPTNREV